MKQELTTRSEKFNQKLKKTVVLQAEQAVFQEKSVKEALNEFAKYGVIGVSEFKRQGLDIEADNIAMVASERGIGKFFETLTLDRHQIVAEATAPLLAKMEQMEKTMQIMMAMIEHGTKPARFVTAPTEDIKFVGYEELQIEYSRYSAPKKELVVPPVDKVVAESILTLVKKRGPIPHAVKAAKSLIDSHTVNGKVRWKDGVRDLCLAYITILKYNNQDDYNNTAVMQEKHVAFYRAVYRAFGKYKEAIANLGKEVK